MFNSCHANLMASLFTCQFNAWMMNKVAFVCLVCVVACAGRDSVAVTTNEDAGEGMSLGSKTQTHKRWDSLRSNLHSRRRSWHAHAPHAAACSELHTAFQAPAGPTGPNVTDSEVWEWRRRSRPLLSALSVPDGKLASSHKLEEHSKCIWRCHGNDKAPLPTVWLLKNQL